MLSNSSSSIQRRRRQHRRQNSLEAPLLVTQIPGTVPQQRPTHRRGQSLEQHHSTLSPSFGRLSTHEQQDQPSPKDTNIGQYPQHNMQGTQQHCTAQPGLQHRHHQQQQQMDSRMHSHMLQMMQEQASRQGIAPPEQAIRNIQDQIKSFYDHYPHYISTSPQGASPNLEVPMTASPMMQATTPVLMQGSPANGFLPSPPPTQKTGGGRFVRHMDAAPMPISLANVPMVHIQQPQTHDMPLFEPSFGSDYSSYQSSMVDPMSPHMSPAKQASLRAMSMPTLFEDGGVMPSPEMMAQQQMMLAAQEGRFYYPDSPIRIPMSPREAMLASLEVDASIEDTGISAEEVAAYISPQDIADSKWTCMFPDCGKKFGRKENIRSHVQTHLGDRQFKCNHCGKCFVRQHDLKRHAKIHSGDKPHKCPCGNGFARQDALTRHRQRGVCPGALPGFERREVKRGRPRKNRPELGDRSDKASKARALDARRGSDSASVGAYSPADSSNHSSPGSSMSNPFTPPPMADYTDEAFSLSTPEGVEAFIKAYKDTPPTSPASASPNNRQQAVGGASAPPSPSAMAGSEEFDFCAPLLSQPTAISPGQLTSPLLSNTATPALSRPVSQGRSQAESSEAYLESSGSFDWAAIDAQPSLVNDPFSPVGVASPAGTDLWGGEEDVFGIGKVGGNEGLFGGRVGVVGIQNEGMGMDMVMEGLEMGGWDGEISWLN